MFAYPASHYHATPSYSSYRQPSYRPSASCGQYHHHLPSRSPYSAYGDINEQDGDEDYYAYLLEAARREQRAKELQRQRAREAAIEAEEQRQQEYYARRRAQEKAYMVMRAEAQARAEAEAEARAEAEERARLRKQDQYRRYVAEQQRQAQLEQARERQARLEQAQQEQAERSRRTQAAYPFGDDFARLFFGLPAPTSASSPPAERASTPSTSPSPASTSAPTSSARQQTPAQPDYNQLPYVTAIRVIQTHAREQIGLRRRSKAIEAIRAKFQTCKDSFKAPEPLIFDSAKSTSETPVLAYNPANRPFQEYDEQLTRLLTDLDDISSGGSQRIKDARKALNKDIQVELEKLEVLKKEEWEKQQALQEPEQAEQKEEEVPVCTKVQVTEQPEAASVEEKMETSAEPAAISTDSEPVSEAPTVSSEQDDQRDSAEDSSATDDAFASTLPNDIISTAVDKSQAPLAGEQSSGTSLAPAAEQSQHIHYDIQSDPSPSLPAEYPDSKQTTFMLPSGLDFGLSAIVTDEAEHSGGEASDGSESDTSFEML